jgi:nucleotide-binding universal stress UspA family protein
MTLTAFSSRITFRNILCATDFSPASDAALAYAVAIARHYGGKLYVAHVTAPELYVLGPPGFQASASAHINDDAEQRIRALMSSGYLRDVSHEALVRRGETASVLLELSTEFKIDLLVVGTHGRRGLSKLLMGSTSEEIVRLASCPVLTVGPRNVSTLADLELKRILYATDFSEESLRALPFALSLGQEFGGCIVLAHVVSYRVDDFLDRQSVERKVTERLRALASEEENLWSDQNYHVEFGSPVEGILRTAIDRNADLIVMGARGASAAFRTSTSRLGATADSVASLSTCPVLTVRELSPARMGRMDDAASETVA